MEIVGTILVVLALLLASLFGGFIIWVNLTRRREVAQTTKELLRPGEVKRG